MAGPEQNIDLQTEQTKDDHLENEVVETEHTQEEPRGDTDPQEKLIKLPMSRIRGIIKTDPDVKITSQDAVITIAKAAELFIQNLAKEAAVKTLRDKKKTVSRKHLDDVLDSKDRYAFLEGVIESFED